MTDVKPTPTQSRYLAYIQAYTEGFGYPPAESEIGAAMKVSPPSVNQMMKTLEKKGFIRRQRGVPRSIKILLPPDSIPTWKERITSTKRVWVRVDPSSQTNRQSGNATVYCFKITLNETQPAIWRRIETKDVMLEKLHELIQTAMGWTNSHLHCFKIGDRRYTDPRLIDDAFNDLDESSYTEVRVSDLVAEHGLKMQLTYEYDYGDGWQHTIKLEKVTEALPQIRYPRCIDGARACPPEDVGGVWGYADFVKAITNPDHEQHEDVLEWNGPFDPDDFDPAEATRQMKRGLPAW